MTQVRIIEIVQAGEVTERDLYSDRVLFIPRWKGWFEYLGPDHLTGQYGNLHFNAKDELDAFRKFRRFAHANRLEIVSEEAN